MIPNKTVADSQPRCSGLYRGKPCNRKLAEAVTRPWCIRCPRCKTINVSPPVEVAKVKNNNNKKVVIVPRETFFDKEG